jgi:GTP1/Obg family GTP-binding protein
MKNLLVLAKSIKSGELSLSDILTARKVERQIARQAVEELASHETKEDIDKAVQAGVGVYADLLESVATALEDDAKVDAIIHNFERVMSTVERITERVQERMIARAEKEKAQATA